MKNDLIILAGGRGLRLKKYTKKIPKPLLKVNKISMIENILNQFSRYDFNKIYKRSIEVQPFFTFAWPSKSFCLVHQAF